MQRAPVFVLVAACLIAGGSVMASCSSDAEDGAGETRSEDDASEEDDDASGDDASGGDDSPSSSNTFETDAGVVEVVFDVNEELCGSDVERTCGDESCLDGRLVQNGETGFSLCGCCADEQASACGLNLGTIGILLGLTGAGCEALDRPGSEDPACEQSPPLQAAINELNGIQLPGCCQENGRCGYSASFQGIGFGCVSPALLDLDEGPACDYER